MIQPVKIQRIEVECSFDSRMFRDQVSHGNTIGATTFPLV